jgi:hypothetical protein
MQISNLERSCKPREKYFHSMSPTPVQWPEVSSAQPVLGQGEGKDSAANPLGAELVVRMIPDGSLFVLRRTDSYIRYMRTIYLRRPKPEGG